MTTKRKEAVLAAFRGLDDHDYRAFTDLHAEACTYRMNFDTYQGREAMRAMIQGWFAAFPDLRHEVLDYVEDGDRAAWVVRISGTHTAPMQTPQGAVPATGKRIDFRAADLAHFDSAGKATSWNIYFDMLQVLEQLGIAPKS